MSQPVSPPKLDIDSLRQAIRKEYAAVANSPSQGFHFHTGRPLAKLLGYADAWIDALPESTVASLAGTGNPFSLGNLLPGERVVDVGTGAGFNSLIAAPLVRPTGAVIGVDMTPEMLQKARAAAAAMGYQHVEFRDGYAETLPVLDGWADVVLSNGVANLCPDKLAVFREMYRVLKPGGRLQIGDILVQQAIPPAARENVDLWTG